jgi:hypothetical protein
VQAILLKEAGCSYEDDVQPLQGVFIHASRNSIESNLQVIKPNKKCFAVLLTITVWVRDWSTDNFTESWSVLIASLTSAIIWRVVLALTTLSYAIMHVLRISFGETLGIQVDVLHFHLMWYVHPVFLWPNCLSFCTTRMRLWVISAVPVFRHWVSAVFAHILVPFSNRV